jgi:hypothetical protein
MTDGAIVASTAATAEYDIANAIKASGAIVSMEPHDFEAILQKAEAPLIVHAQGGVFTTKHYYLTAYKGLIFYTRTQTPLPLPRGAELVEARKIWVPS